MASHTVSHSHEIFYRTMVDLAGGRYKGIFQAIQRKDGTWHEALCLFDSPQTGSTLALPVSQVSAENVRKKIAESNALFEEFAEKACTRVLRQFSAV
ncbi:MAG TPA: hypothetical protein VMI32_07090 [Candidatus Solibacter sp.]|nr:hypothetical protein [Candidatus Solibacter sp.]